MNKTATLKQIVALKRKQLYKKFLEPVDAVTIFDQRQATETTEQDQQADKVLTEKFDE